MSDFCPAYPKPAKSKASLFWMFFGKRRSWLDGLFERSYRMKMGHVGLPGFDLFMVNQPDIVRRILVEEADRYPKHWLLHRMLEPLLGESIFTTNGDVWKRQRRLMDPAFEAARIKIVFDLMKEAADAMTARLDRLEDGVIHDIDAEMTHVTADIIFRTILSVPIETADAATVYNAFLWYQKLSPGIAISFMYKLPFLFRPWLDSRRSKKAAKDIRDVLARIIRARYDAWERGEKGEYQDVLASLLEQVDPVTGTRFDFDELVNQITMLFLAGHETSASGLTWALYLMSQVPEVQERMHKETIAVMGGDAPEFSHIKKMSLVWNVFRETLRLFPPVGFFTRESSEDETIRDKRVRKGSSIVVSPWLIHRHRDLWQRPDAFDPDRFDKDESAKESLRCAYLPFSMGPRVCIGAGFAMQEAALILGVLARRYRFEAAPGFEPKPVGRLTIRSENGMKLRVWKRPDVTKPASPPRQDRQPSPPAPL